MFYGLGEAGTLRCGVMASGATSVVGRWYHAGSARSARAWTAQRGDPAAFNINISSALNLRFDISHIPRGRGVEIGRRLI
jgi:hypothetical protein